MQIYVIKSPYIYASLLISTPPDYRYKPSLDLSSTLFNILGFFFPRVLTIGFLSFCNYNGEEDQQRPSKGGDGEDEQRQQPPSYVLEASVRTLQEGKRTLHAVRRGDSHRGFLAGKKGFLLRPPLRGGGGGPVSHPKPAAELGHDAADRSPPECQRAGTEPPADAGDEPAGGGEEAGGGAEPDEESEPSAVLVGGPGGGDGGVAAGAAEGVHGRAEEECKQAG